MSVETPHQKAQKILDDAAKAGAENFENTTKARSVVVPATDALYFNLLSPPPDEVTTFAQKMRWFARLSLARRTAEDDLDQIRAKIAELEPHLLEEMALNGVEKQTVDGMTIYPQTDLIVSKKADKEGVTTEVLCEALRQCGLSYMVNDAYSPSSLKSWIKEKKEQGIEIPDLIASKLNIIEKQKLVTRKS
jgi:hypothetical protein